MLSPAEVSICDVEKNSSIWSRYEYVILLIDRKQPMPRLHIVLSLDSSTRSSVAVLPCPCGRHVLKMDSFHWSADLHFHGTTAVSIVADVGIGWRMGGYLVFASYTYVLVCSRYLVVHEMEADSFATICICTHSLKGEGDNLRGEGYNLSAPSLYVSY